MATPLQLSDLRAMIADETQPHQFEDADLNARIDTAEGDLRFVAGQVWSVKAARLSNLVDVTDGPSSRKLSQMHDHALKMSEHYSSVQVTASVGNRSGTRAIVRPQ